MKNLAKSNRLKTRVLAWALALAMLVSMAPLAGLTAFGAVDSRLTFNEQGKFNVMQITDIQDDNVIESGTIELMNRAIAKYKPDLVVFTGDNVKGTMSSPDFNASIEGFLAPLIANRIHYAVSFGNHDCEKNAFRQTPTKSEQYNMYKSKAPDLFVDHAVAVDNSFAYGAIPVYANSSASEPSYFIYVMDSGDYGDNGEGYGTNNTPQIDYYIQNSQNHPGVPSLWFQHIIVPDVYGTILTANSSQALAGSPAFSGHGSPFSSYSYYLSNGSNSSTVNLAASGSTTLSEIYKEPPCPPNLSYYQKTSNRSSASYGSKTLYEAWMAYGNMKGAYFGHDHKNSFVGTTSDGITLGYSKAATLHSYNDGNPGLRAFEIDVGGNYTTESVTLTGLMREEGVFNTEDDIAGTLNVPQVLYVGAADNSKAKQEYGNALQTHTINYSTKAWRETDRYIDFDLPGATNVSLSVTGGTGISVSQNSASNPYQWRLDSAILEAGDVIQYKVTYTLDGVVHTRTSYSYIDNIPSPAGYYAFTRTYRGSSNNSGSYADVTYTVNLFGENNGIYNVYGRSRAHNVDYYETTTNHSDTPYNNLNPIDKYGYYNWDATGDNAFVDKSNDPNYLFYAMNFYSPSRARMGCDWTRNVAAGKSPASTVYVDTSRYDNLSALNLTLAFYTPQNTQNNNIMNIGVGVKAGDASYTKDNWNSTYTANYVSTSAGTGEVLLGRTKASTQVISLVNSAKLPDTGSSVTLIPRVWAKNTASGDNINATYTPLFVEFQHYSKAFLRAKVNEVRLSNLETSGKNHPAFAAFESAYREAVRQLSKPDTNQHDIDVALAALERAIADLSVLMDDVSPEGEIPTDVTVSIPGIIYVAETYTISEQKRGNKIQTAFPRFIGWYESATYPGANVATTSHGTFSGTYANNAYSNLTNYTFTAPAGATEVDLEITSSDSGNANLSYTHTVSLGGRMLSGTITGTAPADSYIRYIFTYKLNGEVITVTKGSAVENAPTPSGWYTYVRTYYENISLNPNRKASVRGVQWVSSVGVPLARTAFLATVRGGGRAGSKTTKHTAPKYVNFATLSNGDSGVYIDDTYGGWLRQDPLRNDVGDGKNERVIAGNHTEDDDNDRVITNIYVDPTDNRTISQLDLFWQSLNFKESNGFDNGKSRDLKAMTIYSGDPQTWRITMDGVAENRTTNTLLTATDAANMFISGVNGSQVFGDDNRHGERTGDSFGYKYTGTNVITSNQQYLHLAAMYTTGKDTAYKLVTGSQFLFNINAVDQTTLRNLVNTELRKNRQLSHGYLNDAAWTAYKLALANAQAALESVIDSGDPVAALNTAIANLNYEPANYDNVRAAIARVQREVGGTMYYYANDNDPDYMNLDSTVALDGLYPGHMYVGGINELWNAINDIDWELDKRYQSIVDGWAASIIHDWEGKYLLDASYVEVNRILTFEDFENGMIVPPSKYSLTHGNLPLPRSYYTDASLAVWDAAVEAVVYGYKIPKQGDVDTFAANLDTAYNGLTIKTVPAGYTVKYVNDTTGASISADRVVAFNGEQTSFVLGTVVNERYIDITGYTYLFADEDDEGIKTLTLGPDASANVIVFRYAPNTNTAYRVEHFKQANTGDSPTWTRVAGDTQNLTGTTGTAPAYSPNSYEGFTYQPSLSEVPNIAADGSTVVNLYYTRNRYTLTFNGQGATVGEVPASRTVYFGSPIGELPVPTRTGYTFGGWTTTAEAGGAEVTGAQNYNYTTDITIYAQWTPGPTSFVVHYWGENLAGGTFNVDLGYTPPVASITGNTITPADYLASSGIEGFAWDSTQNESIQVAASGTILNVYYTRNSYQMSFNSGGGSAVAPVTYKFGASTQAPAQPTRQGYIFIGWYKSNADDAEHYNFGAMPANAVTVYAKWQADPNNTYTVNHYGQALGESSYALLLDSYTAYGATNTQVTAQAASLDFTGFAYNLTLNQNTSITIAADGTSVLNIYYSRETYIIRFMNNYNALDNSVFDTQNVKYEGAIAEPSPAPERTHYNFLGWYYDREGTDEFYFEDAVAYEAFDLYAKWEVKGADYTAVDAAAALANADKLPASRPYDTAYRVGGSHEVYVLYDESVTVVDGFYPRSMFTDESLAEMQAKVDAVVRGLTSPEQAAVDGFAAAITAAYNELELKAANTGALSTLIAGSALLVQSNYTPQSWTAFTAALAAANTALTLNLKAPSQAYVDSIYADLEGAIEALVLNGADYSGVHAAWASKPADFTDYTPESVSALFDYYDNIDWELTILDQLTVDDYEDELYDLIAALEYLPADYSAVYAAIESTPDNDSGARDVDETYLRLVYTGTTVDALIQAISDVNWNLTRSPADKLLVSGYAQAINNAVAALAYRYYSVTVNYVDEDGVEVHAPYSVNTYTYNSAYSVSSPTVANYATETASVSGTVTENVVRTVVYTRSAAAYTVEHWFEDLVGGYTVDAVTDDGFGSVGATPEYDARTVTGFAQNTTATVVPLIAQDGSTIVKVYYDRISYQLDFKVLDSVAFSTNVKFGYAIVPPTDLTMPQHYEFKSWGTYPSTMPADNLVINAIVRELPRLVARDGSTTVFEDGLIFGLKEKLKFDSFEDDFVEVLGDGYLEYSNYFADYLGTGLEVYLCDGETDEILETYVIIIFGDIDGNGVITTRDVDLIKSHGISITLNQYQRIAADLNMDRRVTSNDADLLKSTILGRAVLDQEAGGVF